MTTQARSVWSSWLQPNHDWQGKKALAPIGICYRILDIYSWCFGFFGALAVVMVFLRGGAEATHNPFLWMISVTLVVQCVSAVMRGWPFPVRYGILATCLWLFCGGTLATLGVAPNLPFVVIMFISSALIFFGPRAGWIALGLMVVLHAVAAWGWFTGLCPAYIAGPLAARAYIDYTAPVVWVRVIAGVSVMTAALLLIMQTVLSGLNAALRESTQTMRSLAQEQEYRARAEEARLKAERTAREAQKFDALGRLAGGVAHDINNALCVVKCWNSVLSQESADPLVREAMAEIGVATDNAGQLTQHLLAFSRTEPVKTETVDLADAVRREARTLAHLLSKQIDVRAEATDSVHVRLGRGQLQEIILNLALNARDAMPTGGRLLLRVRREMRPAPTAGEAAAAFAVLEVEDTGVGMDEAVLSRIFEPFFTTKQSGQGTGLGLAMVYGVVNGAGGSIRVQSTLGRGTCFILELPASRAESAAPEPSPDEPGAGDRCLVMVVDDNAVVRNLIGRILQRDGFAVAMAKDGDDALAQFAGTAAETGLLIVDGIMPGTPTAEVIRVIESRRPDCRIIISSGRPQGDLVRQGIDAGRYVLLPKPFEISQLRAAVTSALGVKVS